jgi:hypothetical protein
MVLVTFRSTIKKRLLSREGISWGKMSAVFVVKVVRRNHGHDVCPMIRIGEGELEAKGNKKGKQVGDRPWTRQKNSGDLRRLR